MPRKSSTPKTPKVKATAKTVALVSVQPKKSTGRKCSICSHSRLEEINSQIVKGISFRVISRQLLGDAKHHDSVRRHTENCLNLEIRALINQNKLDNADNHYSELVEQLQFAKEMQSAAREWLTDPLNSIISFMPRAEELDVIYMDYINLDFFGRPTRQRQKLSEILNKIQTIATHIKFRDYSYKISDTRDFALRTIDAVDKLLDKFARIEGLYTKEKENSDELTQIKKQIENVAASQGTDYKTELRFFLENYSGKIKPELKAQLTKELN